MATVDFSILDNWKSIPQMKYWLNGRRGMKPKAPKTQINYLSSMRAYMEFRGMNPSEMIQEARKARKIDEDSDEELPVDKVIKFHSWLLSEYEQKARGRNGGRKPNGKKGVSETLAHGVIGAIRGFYRANGFPLTIQIDSPAPKEENYSYEFRAKDVRKLIQHTRSLRDRAVILTMFQSGMDVQTLCRLEYAHIAEGMEKGNIPIMLTLVRQKSKVKFRTFIGEDGVEVIRTYLEERRYKGENITYDSPLFLQEGKNKKQLMKLKPRNVDDIFKNLVVQAGIITQERIDRADINPARPYALRAAFSSILGLKGVDRDAVNYFMGHKMPYNSAYFRMTGEELRELYLKGESGLSISGIRSMTEVEEKLNKEIERRDYIITGMEERIKKVEKGLEVVNDLNENIMVAQTILAKVEVLKKLKE